LKFANYKDTIDQVQKMEESGEEEEAEEEEEGGWAHTADENMSICN
jgi:hypothetical protein